MAGLSPPGGPGRDRVGRTGGSDGDRAQIILVTAFALAVAFVALSVVINGAIFTQNLATRGDTAGGGNALQQHQQAEQMVGDLLEHENEDSPPDNQDLKEAIRELSNASSYQQSVTGRAVDYEYAGGSEGKRVFQTANENFTNTTGAEEWTIAESVNGTRQFHVTVTDVSALDNLTDDSFVVILSNGSATWNMTVYDPGTGVGVETVDPTGTTNTCTANGVPVEINVTAGRLGGQPCAALDFGKRLDGEYDITYANADSIKGTYSLVVNTTVGMADAPNNETVLYSATVEYTYRTANLVYETDIRVAPGEPDD